MLQGWWLWRITPTSSPGPGQSEVELGCRVSLILPGISASAAPGIHGTTLSSRGQNWLYNFKQDNHLSKAITSTCQEQLVKMAQKQWQECSEKFGPSIQLLHTAGKRHLLIKHQSNAIFFILCVCLCSHSDHPSNYYFAKSYIGEKLCLFRESHNFRLFKMHQVWFEPCRYSESSRVCSAVFCSTDLFNFTVMPWGTR